MTVNELADWFRVNEHKFIFYLYAGGSGGEFVCSILAEKLYNRHGHYVNEWKLNNRYTFKEWMLNDALPAHDDGSGNWFDTYEALASHILSTTTLELDSEALQKFSEQDEQYIIRAHTLRIYPGLFTKSKVYECWDGEYDDYICTILNAKTKLKPYYSTKYKLEAIEERHKHLSTLDAMETRNYFMDSIGDLDEYRNLTPLDKIIKYADSVITDEESMLHDYTISMMCYPDSFGIDLDPDHPDHLPIEELQEELRQMYLHSWKYYARRDHRWWKVLHEHIPNEGKKEIAKTPPQSRPGAIKFEFKDLFVESDIFDKDFVNKMIEWDRRNMEYIKLLGLEEVPYYWKMPCTHLYFSHE